MSMYLPEPTTAAEALARARASSKRMRLPSTLDTVLSLQRQIDGMAAELRQAKAEAATLRAEAALADEFSEAKTKLLAPKLANDIVSAVADETGMTIAQILGPSRERSAINARHEAIYRVYRATGWSLPRMGKMFSRDHTTILHAIRRVKKLRGES